MGKYVKNIKVAKNLSKCLPAVMDVLYLIMLHINGNVDKKFQSFIYYWRKSRFPQNVSDRRTYGIIE